MNQPANRDAAPAPAPARIGQGTAVEQSRAVAQVMAAVEIAHRFPRNAQAAIREMREACAQKGLADRAFYRFPRAGQTVSGPSVHLARELARIWGHVDYGLIEMRRDDDYHQSEMQAFAWDLQTNARNSSTFIVPHIRDTKKGPSVLTDMRDIYENNANNGARRVREAIFAILPPWFVDEAKDICNRTLVDGGGVPLPRRVADVIRNFEPLGVVVDQLETKLGRPSAKWTEHDVAQLSIIGKSVQRGEVRAEEEFPPVRVTVDEITAKPAAPVPAEPTSPLSYSAQEIAEGS
jgi:hypothetical protein